MKTTKILSFVGMERCDLVIYLALIMASHKCRTLVIDNSISHDLFKLLKKPSEDSEYAEYGRIVYMKNVAYSENAFEKFDLVLVYHGYNIDDQLLATSDKVVIVTDYFKSTLEMFNAYVDMEWINEMILPKKRMLIYRDKMSNKVSELYLQKELGIKNIEEDYICHFDESDYFMYQMLTYNGPTECKNISSDIKALLSMLKDDILGKKRKKRNIEEEEEE